MKNYAKTNSQVIIRPANTTAYAINGVISNSTSAGKAWEFSPKCDASCNEVALVGGVCVDNNTAGTAPNIEALIFSSQVPMDGDRVLLSTSFENMQGYLGSISFNEFNTISTLRYSEGNMDRPFVVKEKFYVVFISKDAYTPISGEVFSFSFNLMYQ